MSGGVIGVDPAWASTGYAVVAGSGDPARGGSPSGRSGPRRERPIQEAAATRGGDGIAALAAEHEVGAGAVESWFVHPVSRAAMGMAEARGAILVALAAAAIEVTEYAPNTIKQAVTGHGGAGKAQVRAMVERLSGTGPGVRPRGRRPGGRHLPSQLRTASGGHPPRALA